MILAALLAAGVLSFPSISPLTGAGYADVEQPGPALALKHPPCGTPEAKGDKNCTRWLVRPDPVQPKDEWPKYEIPTPDTVDPFASHNLQISPASPYFWSPITGLVPNHSYLPD